MITAVEGLDRPFTLEIVLYADLIDVCVDGERCIVNRCPEHQGDRLFFFAHASSITITDLKIEPLAAIQSFA